ncbi:MAG: PhnD/SsuA/transferrin family substrate-binding protein [Polyangiaceae bacterium]
MVDGAKKLVFALAWQRNAGPVGDDLAEFFAWLSDQIQVRVVPRSALSYPELAEMMRGGGADLAWLPPIVYTRLEGEGHVVSIATHQRAGSSRFESVLIVRRDSAIGDLEDLRDRRVGWVDRWSAAGYVLPRIALLARGVDPRELFGEERFFGSHDSAVHALLAERVDAVATFARVDERGNFPEGGWSHAVGADARVRVLAGFGSIPADVTAAHTKVDSALRQKVAVALAAVGSHPQALELARRIFGIDRFRSDEQPDYEGLRRALESAYECGLIEERVVR